MAQYPVKPSISAIFYIATSAVLGCLHKAKTRLSGRGLVLSRFVACCCVALAMAWARSRRWCWPAPAARCAGAGVCAFRNQSKLKSCEVPNRAPAPRVAQTAGKYLCAAISRPPAQRCNAGFVGLQARLQNVAFGVYPAVNRRLLTTSFDAYRLAYRSLRTASKVRFRCYSGRYSRCYALSAKCGFSVNRPVNHPEKYGFAC